MAPEVKFTSYGIPYIVEFANVKFRPTHSRPPLPPSKLNNVLHTNGSMSTLLSSVETASSETLVYPPKNVFSTPDGTSSQGLYIRFASHRYRPPRKLSEGRLLRLKHRIAKAVLAAGMDSTPVTEKDDPMEVHKLSRVSYGSIKSTDSYNAEDESGSLFRGTYGQVMNALHSVGLTTTPCKESGVDEATRLGALFVAKHSASGDVEFTKLTLWA
ncbi:uncharacterized protein FIBRA_06654 [Fibroporia radiculosa]|uniref:Uncharacterized protein n=1 Tax=Fibroporia radiculosa TaxID=599839 RepID=J4H469_9APHY|nr:uncharacterized protein FIBRA_06654 [Fibroporia radiculosa]CCM04474.1 predicted protein [Fibroporia radiculosa]